MRQEIRFDQIPTGTKFRTIYTKRNYGAVKVAPTEASAKGTLAEACGPTYTGNAIILTDHNGRLATDHGVVVQVKDEEIVRVER